MVLFRFLMVFLVYSTVLVGCGGEPFIAIDISTGGGFVERDDGGSDAESACKQWLRACPGIKVDSKVTHIHPISGTVKLYIVRSSEASKSIHVPPSQVTGTVKLNAYVTVETLDDGTYKIIGP